MKFLLDESAELRIATILEGKGHDVKVVKRDFSAGIPDRQVLELAYTEQRILITNDRDFGELIFREKLPHAGVIYFRLLLDSSAKEKIYWLREILTTHRDRLDQFLVVTPRGIRPKRQRSGR